MYILLLYKNYQHNEDLKWINKSFSECNIKNINPYKKAYFALVDDIHASKEHDQHGFHALILLPAYGILK
jgi:hypothetical protein